MWIQVLKISPADRAAVILLVLFWIGLGFAILRSRAEMNEGLGHMLTGLFLASFAYPGVALRRRIRKRKSISDVFIYVVMGTMALLAVAMALHVWQVF